MLYLSRAPLSGLSRSLGLDAKLLAGVQGAEPPKLIGFSHIKDQNQHFESTFLFSEDFLLSVLLFFLPSVIFFWERCSCAPVDFEALLKKMLSIRAKTRRLFFFHKTISSNNSFTLIENNFCFFLDSEA